MAVRVILAEDNALLREGVSRLVERVDDLELVGTAADLDSLMRLVESENPDVVVTDIRMPPTGTDEGIRAAAWLRAEHPHVGVVVLSQYADPAYALALLADGSEGRAYLLKERVADPNELMEAVREVAAGRSVIDPKVVDALVADRLGAIGGAFSWESVADDGPGLPTTTVARLRHDLLLYSHPTSVRVHHAPVGTRGDHVYRLRRPQQRRVKGGSGEDRRARADTSASAAEI